MKKYNSYKVLITTLFIILTVFSSCKKESENMFTLFKGLKIEYKNEIASDEVYVEVNLSKVATGAVMSKLILTETGSTTPVYTISIPFAQRYTYPSGVIVLKTTDPVNTTYTVKILDDLGNDISSQVTKTYPAGKMVINNPVLITDEEIKTLEEGTIAYLDYTIVSENENIKSINLYSFTGASEPADVNIATVSEDANNKRVFRGAVRLTLNRDGMSRFRIYAKNENGDYIGDGYKHVNTNVATGFDLSANKFIYAPNAGEESSLEQLPFTSKCFYSISRKQVYTYDEAKEISEDIDFGIYFTANANTGAFYVNIYNMSDAVSGNAIIAKYDLTNWTKRNTKFATILDGGIFNTTLFSGVAITTEAKKYAIFTTRNRVASMEAGKMVYFLTPEGKNGAILINSISRDFQKRWYANIDVKVVK